MTLPRHWLVSSGILLSAKGLPRRNWLVEERRVGLMCLRQERIGLLGLALVLAATLAAAEGVPRPYLMLVTFGAPGLRDWTEAQSKRIDQWPYAGIASSVVGGYDTERIPSRADYQAAVKLLRTSRVRVWPWVFLNRMIGRGKGQAHTSAKTSPYFERIRGWDLEDKTGARTDYLALWRLSLQLAKDLGAPGIVLDLETYNDYSTYQLNALADCGGWSPGQTATLLEDLGRAMARIVEQEYPSAIIWSFFTGLGGNRTTGLVCKSFLEESAKRKIPTKLVDGGETTVGYYNPSAEVLTTRIKAHVSALAPFAGKYKGQLVAGGTIAPYHEPERLTWWILDASKAGGRTYANMDEFRPNFEALFARCEYVWIYGASAAHCVPFSEEDAATTAALHRVLGEVYPRWREAYRLLPLPLREGSSARMAHRVKPVFAEQPVDVSDWTKGDPKTDMAQAELTVGPDTTVTKLSPKSVKMTVHVNWKEPAGAQYPVGWPMIHKTFDPPLDLSRCDLFEFWLRIHSDAVLPSPPLKFGFSNDNKEPLWQEVNTTAKDQWMRISVPLDQVGRREKVTRLTFYIAESWYRAGDVVTFYLDGLKLLRQTTPEIRSLSVEPVLISAGSSGVEARYELGGNAVENGCKLKWRLRASDRRRVVRQGDLAVSRLAATIPLATADLPPGAYTLALDLLGAVGQRLDGAETQFAVVRS